MDSTQQVLSDIVVYNKYAKYLPEKGRRETWDEIVDRYVIMMIKRYASKEDAEFYKTQRELGVSPDDLLSENYYDTNLSQEIVQNAIKIYNKEVLMSMRMSQFSGPAIEKNESRGYNCSFVPIDDYRSFGEIMLLLLGGTGVGYSVQTHHIEQLPEIKKPLKEQKFLISDDIEGWATAIKHLMKAYFGIRKTKPRFDFSDIRKKGERLVTAGGKAPGPEPLKRCLYNIELILERKEDGEKLTSLEVHDIVCHIADAVLAGGIRRAALISLFSVGDVDMMTCKYGQWWEQNPQRGRANNSQVLLRHKVDRKTFFELWEYIKNSGSGEPGLYLSNDKEYGTNPCCEISLRPYSFCNLTEIHGGTVYTQKEFNERAKVAAFFGTLQAGFTDFHFLRDAWKTATEKDYLIGVGITGICNGPILKLNLSEAAKEVLKENERIAELIGIKPAARTTTIKPSGSTSCVLGCSSGIHAWYSEYYIRNMQCAVGDDLYNFFVEHHPELIKIMDYDPKSAVIGIPQKAPKGAILREDETALDMLERVRRFNLEWVKAGHRRGANTNNVSATVYIKPEEWSSVGEWMWDNKSTYNGLSVLPYDGGTYKDAPFMEITEEEFNEKMKHLEKPINLTLIRESEDNTDLAGEIACGPGGCEVI